MPFARPLHARASVSSGQRRWATPGTYAWALSEESLPPREIKRMSDADESRAILMVDDEERLRRALERSLCQGRCRAQAVASAEEALAISKERTIDLVITDLVMPGMSGTALVRRVRNTFPHQDHHHHRLRLGGEPPGGQDPWAGLLPGQTVRLVPFAVTRERTAPGRRAFGAVPGRGTPLGGSWGVAFSLLRCRQDGGRGRRSASVLDNLLHYLSTGAKHNDTP